MGRRIVDGAEIQVLQMEEDDYISLTDMVRKIDNGYPAQIQRGLWQKRDGMAVHNTGEALRESSPAINLVLSKDSDDFNNKIKQLILPLKVIILQSVFI